VEHHFLGEFCRRSNPYDTDHDASMRCIQLMGKHLIPALDRD
jgi:hypothetical protein